MIATNISVETCKLIPLNSTSSGTLTTGIFLKKEIASLLINSKVPRGIGTRERVPMRFMGNGSVTHKTAMDIQAGAEERNCEVFTNCSVNVGNIGHGRDMFNDILYCPEKSMNKKTAEFLNQPLLSAFLPPQFWVTIDRATQLIKQYWLSYMNLFTISAYEQICKRGLTSYLQSRIFTAENRKGRLVSSGNLAQQRESICPIPPTLPSTS